MSENTPIGSILTRVKASDKDANENGDIRYEITSGNEGGTI